MDHTETIELTREKLYDLVWSEPIRTLAPKYGLSDVALAKWCRKMLIPRPWVGYWQQLAAGQKLRRPSLQPLPPGTDRRLQTLVLQKTEELYAQAKKLDKSVGGLSIRQFHARYPLQIKRQLAAQRPRRRRPRRKGVDRGAIKADLLSFARALMAAEGGAAIVDVIGSVDKHVDRLLAAAGAV